MKRLTLYFIQPPEVPGFNDCWKLTDGLSPEAVLASGPCSTGPNWFFPAGASDNRWQQHYGYMATGLTFLGRCIVHPEYGKCILYNDGAAILAAGPNPAHQGEWYLDQVFFHHSFPSASNADWRGSAGCTTALQSVLDTLLTHVAVGERIVVSTVHGGCA